MPSFPLLPSTVALATHYYATGPALELEEYLSEKVQALLFIAHPLYTGAGRLYLREYRDGKLLRSAHQEAARGPTRYVDELRRTAGLVQSSRIAFDVFIAGDSLLAGAGLWLRRKAKVQSVVLYSIDYVPRRFRSRLLNTIYHRFDRFAVRHVNVVWNVSSAIEDARRKRDRNRTTAPQLEVPVGAHVRRIRHLPLSQAKGHQLAFLGHVTEKQGLQLVIAALPLIRQFIPSVRLLIIGDGPYSQTLRSLADQHGVAESIEFAGFVQDHAEIEARLAESALALAPYTPDPESFTRFADPGKVKTYMACGIPVVLTDVPSIARLVSKAGAGIVVPYRADALAEAVISYLSNPEELQEGRQNAIRLADQYDWEHIFAKAWAETMPMLKPTR